MIIFAGGGSGGHIIPALAIYEELGAGRRAVFVCSDRPLDAAILKREGVDFRVVPAKPMAKSVRGMYRFVRGWGPSVRAGRKLIREAGRDVRVVAMGGFVAAPIAQAARAEGVGVTLVNLDAVPGKANRLIAKRAEVLFSAAKVVGPASTLAWRLVPPIVRRSSLTNETAAECRRALGLDPSRSTLLVTGGSQGAVSVNQVVLRAVRERREAFVGEWQVIHQTGRGEDAAAHAAYDAAGITSVVRPFFDQMGRAWAAADLAVSRAGAGGVADAWAYRVPTLFLPNPYHRDQHQRHNAARLVEAGAAVIERDLIEAGQNTSAVDRLVRLLGDERARREMKARLEAMGPADGAAQISRELD